MIQSILKDMSKQVMLASGKRLYNELDKYPVPQPISNMFNGFILIEDSLSQSLLATSFWTNEYLSYDEALELNEYFILFLNFSIGLNKIHY